MSALGQKRTWRDQIAMSALPPKADIRPRDQDVCFGPRLSAVGAAAKGQVETNGIATKMSASYSRGRAAAATNTEAPAWDLRRSGELAVDLAISDQLAVSCSLAVVEACAEFLRSLLSGHHVNPPLRYERPWRAVPWRQGRP